MKSYIDCIPCIMHNIVATLNGHIANRADREEAFKKILKELHETDFSKVSPPVLTDNLHKIMLTYLDGRDIYKDIKKECNNEALKIYKHAEELYNNSANKLKTAIKIAIAGNLIDYGALKSFNIENILDDYVHRDFAVDDYADLEVEINKANTILYIGDNTGEIVLDRLLVKHLLSIGKKVTFTVKSHPILNDALLEDAKEVGMDKITEVIESGCATAGTTLAGTNELFHKRLAGADIIISKGQGNFETLTEEQITKPLFYLFLCKCDKIAQTFKTNTFDLMLLSNNNYKKYF
ncbi:MAG: ARMT1-like domain-containing protein [Candidatus Riflemargulisbacteria bacterium]